MTIWQLRNGGLVRLIYSQGHLSITNLTLGLFHVKVLVGNFYNEASQHLKRSGRSTENSQYVFCYHFFLLVLSLRKYFGIEYLYESLISAINNIAYSTNNNSTRTIHDLRSTGNHELMQWTAAVVDTTRKPDNRCHLIKIQHNLWTFLEKSHFQHDQVSKSNYQKQKQKGGGTPQEYNQQNLSKCYMWNDLVSSKKKITRKERRQEIEKDTSYRGDHFEGDINVWSRCSTLQTVVLCQL